MWRSLVARSLGVRKVVSSNLAIPIKLVGLRSIKLTEKRIFRGALFLFSVSLVCQTLIMFYLCWMTDNFGYTLFVSRRNVFEINHYLFKVIPSRTMEKENIELKRCPFWALNG